MQILAREREQQILEELLTSGRPEFLAVYGRRRVGKTYLVKNYCEDRGVFFHITGVVKESTQRQLWNFNQVYVSVFNKGEGIQSPRSWQEAFHRLAQAAEACPTRGRIILFLDELPWLSTHKSGFVQALSYLWNRHLESDPRVLLIVCGSAASWMLSNVIDSRGGLYNRLTRKLRLAPLDLHDTEIYLQQKGVRLARKQIIEVYLALGGIPAYLDLVRPGQSAAQAIAAICFDHQSSLYGEYDRLFRSLFDKSELHTRVIRVLLEHKAGILQQDLFREARIASGSVRTRVKQELIESGFIAEVPGFGARKKGAVIRLIDEYTIFHQSWHRQIANARSPVDPSQWTGLANGRSWRTWAGFAFEGLCQTHQYQLANALGISGVDHTCFAWRQQAGEAADRGVQIDLVIDRADNCINLCEIKFHQGEISLSKSDVQALEHKRQVFLEQTKTEKALFITMVTCFGVKENDHYRQVVDNQITMDALFEN